MISTKINQRPTVKYLPLVDRDKMFIVPESNYKNFSRNVLKSNGNADGSQNNIHSHHTSIASVKGINKSKEYFPQAKGNHKKNLSNLSFHTQDQEQGLTKTSHFQQSTQSNYHGSHTSQHFRRSSGLGMGSQFASTQSSIKDKIKMNIQSFEKMEKKYEKDEQFLNQAILKKRRENEKIMKEQSQQEMMGFFKLSDAQSEIPQLLEPTLNHNGQEQSIRQKIREFLGTNYKTDFFDSLDDFVGCIKVLYGNSKIHSTRMGNAFQKTNVPDQNDISTLQLKFANNIRSKMQQEKEKELLDLIQQMQIAANSNSPTNQENINKIFKHKNSSACKIDPDLVSKDKTVELEIPDLQNLQNQKFELGDEDTYSKNLLRKNKIGEFYKNASVQFQQAQVEMFQKEEQLEVQCSDFKKLSQQLQEYRQTFKENLQSLNIIKKLKSNTFKMTNKFDSIEESSNKNGNQEEPPSSERSSQSLNYKPPLNSTPKQIKDKFRKTIWQIVVKLKKLKLGFDEIFENDVFPTVPLQRENSGMFFKAVKANMCDKVEKMLRQCKYHVFDIDATRQTPLHWAARRNYIDMISILCEHGSDIETQDMGGRTPIFMCVKGGFLDSCRMLLARGASPLVKSLAKNKPSDYTDNDIIKALLRKSEQLHTMMELIPIKKRKEFWIKNAVQVFSHHSSKSSEKLNENLYKLKVKDIQIE